MLGLDMPAMNRSIRQTPLYRIGGRLKSVTGLMTWLVLLLVARRIGRDADGQFLLIWLGLEIVHLEKLSQAIFLNPKKGPHFRLTRLDDIEFIDMKESSFSIQEGYGFLMDFFLDCQRADEHLENLVMYTLVRGHPHHFNDSGHRSDLTPDSGTYCGLAAN